MEKTQYTRCPSCTTAFKVSQKVLESAQGKVRCGACLTVFQATDYLVKPRAKQTSEGGSASLEDDSSDTLESDPSSQTSLQLNNQSEYSQSDSSLETSSSLKAAPFLESEEQLETLSVEAHHDAKLAFEKLGIPLEKVQDLNAETLPQETEASHDDHSIQQKTLEEYLVSDISHQSDLNTEEQGIDDSESFLSDKSGFSEPNLSEPDPGEPDFNQPDFNQPNVNESDINEPDLNISNLEDDFAADEDIVDSSDIADSDDLDTFNDADSEDFNHDLFTEEAFKAEEIDPSENIDEEFELHELANNLTDQIQDTDTEPDPLDEFEGRVEKKKLGLRNAIIAASLLIIFSIVSTKFWNNRQQLAWDNTWGGFTQSVCSVLPCNLQPRRDITKIRLRQRVVSPDEDDENKLDIKLLVINEAEFDQPYPTINIQFSNSEGKKIANKHLLVSEYFPEKTQSLMPPTTEVHIGFKIEMPHPNATGFEFSFE